MEDICKECFITVKRKNYSVHQRTHGENKFSCYICDKKFKTKNSLNQHSSSNDKPKDIECNMCNHVLHSKSALNKHIKRFHEKILYSCPYCNKAFSDKHNCEKKAY